MTVIRPNSVSGITSITAQANEINVFRSDGALAGLQLNGVNFNTTAGVSTFATLNVTTVSIGGTLTYEDVTNVDSVGVITARSTIDAQGDVSIVDKIIHSGDTNTAIRFPSNDNISFEVGGTERLRIDDVDGVVAKHATAANLRVQNSTAATSQVAQLDLAPANGLSGVQLRATSEEDFSTGANRTAFFSAHVRKDGTFYERLRIDSDGRLGINGAGTKGMLEVRASGGAPDKLTAVFGANEGTTAGTLTDNADKACRIGVQNYDTGAKPFTFLVGSSTSGVNSLNIGGGTSLMEGATEIKFSTDTGQVNNGGTTRLSIANDGKITVAANSDIRFTNGTWTGEVAGKIQQNSNNLYIQGGTGGIRFRNASSGVNQFSMTNGGNFEITNGDLVVASGHGIDFSATANSSGSMSNELLDDYEEGSFTPYIDREHNNPIIGYDAQDGYYTKIGRVVYFYAEVRINSYNGNGSYGNTFLRGLPYQSAARTGGRGVWNSVHYNSYYRDIDTTDGERDIAIVQGSSEKVVFYVMRSESSWTAPPAPDANDQFKIGGFYFT